MNMHNKLEAYLFIKGESQAKKDLEGALGVTTDELKELLGVLKEKYSGSGLAIIETETECALVTSDNVSEFIEEIEKGERGGELSKASLETLAIILYKNGATRSEIDYIRGVNSSFILRNLYLRGLVTKSEQDKKSRGATYVPTTDLVRFLGITEVGELPGYESILSKINETIDESETDGK
jgi:segregation and condensation protein B